MKIKVKLFSILRRYEPSNGSDHERIVQFDEQVKVKDVIEELKISSSDVGIILINGIHKDANAILQDGDELAIFPSVAGG